MDNRKRSESDWQGVTWDLGPDPGPLGLDLGADGLPVLWHELYFEVRPETEAMVLTLMDRVRDELGIEPGEPGDEDEILFEIARRALRDQDVTGKRPKTSRRSGRVRSR